MQNGQDITVGYDRAEILTWLSPLEPHLRHHQIRTRRVKDVGDWLLRTEEFRDWKNGDGRSESEKATMFCSGNLGVGKTYISSLIIDTLCDEPGDDGEDNAVACFYFDSMAQKEQTARNVLGSLLKQVVAGCRQIPKEITEAFRRHKKFIGGRELQLPEIVDMLGTLSSTQRTFFCLDAVDECAVPNRANLLLSLKEIIIISSTARLFLTGRPYVGREVGKYFSEGTTLVSISPRNGDIIRYIHKKLAEDLNSDEMDEELEAEIKRKIPETFSEIFLLASLNLDSILQETTIHRRREKLQVITDGLGLEDAYGATLDRIRAQEGRKSGLGMTSLMWICHSERPLGTEELCQALAVEIGSTEYNANNAPSIRTVLSCCQGLVMVDEERSAVRLIHHTLQEYLTSRSSLPQSPHSTIAETCLTYLNSQQVMDLSGSPVQETHPPFLEYSSLYWGAHMKKEPSDRGKMLALELFSHYQCHVSIRLLLEYTLPSYYLSSTTRFHKFTGLHCASIFGLVEVVGTLTMLYGVDINGVDETGATPLLRAAMSGHEAVVQLLLGREGVDPGKPDDVARTPISWAAAKGHEAVVKLLLEREDVDPNELDYCGQTPISRAAEGGHEAVVKLLLGREDVDPIESDIDGGTPISWAAAKGHEAVVKLLLEREDVDPNVLDYCGQTPISRASARGHEAVVKLLLGREDVNPNKPDGNGQTPISRAAENGHAPVVKLFLEREDINPYIVDNYGGTPISWAAVNRHKAVVKLLLEREGVRPDSPCI